MNQLLNEQDLKDCTGYGQRSGLEKFLRDSGIPFFFGNGNTLITTLPAIEYTLIRKEFDKLKGEHFTFE